MSECEQVYRRHDLEREIWLSADSWRQKILVENARLIRLLLAFVKVFKIYVSISFQWVMHYTIKSRGIKIFSFRFLWPKHDKWRHNDLTLRSTGRQSNSIPDALYWDGDRFVLI